MRLLAFCCCCQGFRHRPQHAPNSPNRSSIDISVDPRFLGLQDADVLEDEPIEMPEAAKDIYVGGPAAVCAAALQAKFGKGKNHIQTGRDLELCIGRLKQTSLYT